MPRPPLLNRLLRCSKVRLNTVLSTQCRNFDLLAVPPPNLSLKAKALALPLSATSSPSKRPAVNKQIRLPFPDPAKHAAVVLVVAASSPKANTRSHITNHKLKHIPLQAPLIHEVDPRERLVEQVSVTFCFARTTRATIACAARRATSRTQPCTQSMTQPVLCVSRSPIFSQCC